MIHTGNVEAAYQVFLAVPELDRYLSLQGFQSRITEGTLVLVYEADDKAIGFKVGYPLNDDDFYSWLGGVVPEARQSGVAQALLDYQENWVRDQGYQRLSVKSMNRYPSMLRFLIKNGYQIVHVENVGTDDERIHFLKQLT